MIILSSLSISYRLLHSCHDDASRFIYLLAKPGCKYLEQEDFIPLLQVHILSALINEMRNLDLQNVVPSAVHFPQICLNDIFCSVLFVLVWLGHSGYTPWAHISEGCSWIPFPLYNYGKWNEKLYQLSQVFLIIVHFSLMIRTIPFSLKLLVAAEAVMEQNYTVLYRSKAQKCNIM